MDAISRVERALTAAVERAAAPPSPPRLAAAMRYAVFPRGSRIRPRLCLAVAAACGDDEPAVADAAAAAIELLHCASLVHDDLPCFDDAAMRRGKPSVHSTFGEQLALLAGDALIVLAFQTLARGVAAVPRRLPELLLTIGDMVGLPSGIAAGQAWECEPRVDIAAYHRAKTGALFAAATVAGAAAAGASAKPWRALGERLGEAYQVADDIRDVVGDPAEIGKPVGRDRVLGRPSVALTLGVAGAVDRLKGLAAEAAEAIPPCPGDADLRTLILLEAGRLLPRDWSRRAA
jgi:geranylgeranyl diphosphate synthase, type II